MLKLGTTAPDFALASGGNFYDWLDGSWAVLFSYPKAFTSVCSNELVAVANLLDDFANADIKIAAISTDSAADQSKFGTDLEAEHSCPSSKITQFADPELHIANAYGMVHPELLDQLTIRVTYVIDPAKKIRLAQAYPPPIARDFATLLKDVQAIRAKDAVT